MKDQAITDILVAQDTEGSGGGPPPGKGPVLYFDGVCNLCNGLVTFVLEHERKNSGIRFASLQSSAGEWALSQAGLPADRLETVLLYEGGVMYQRSEAVLRLLRHLKAPWSILGGLKVIPRWVRDRVYGWVAHSRYRMFGRREACMLPTAESRSRFL